MGNCNRATGICECRDGFSGPACDQMLCPFGTTKIGIDDRAAWMTAVCSGNGVCMSLREVSLYQDFTTYYNKLEYKDWDADMIHGCVCDEAWEGPACDQMSCPKGDDPTTSGVVDVQLIHCICYDCAGGLNISFRGEQTAQIPHNAKLHQIEYYLDKLTKLEDYDVSFVLGSSLCSGAPDGSILRLAINIPHGSWSGALSAVASNQMRGKITVASGGDVIRLPSNNLRYYSSIEGTTEFKECSGRGSCNYFTGNCDCYQGWASSDGKGDLGSRGDCGYRYPYNSSYLVDGVWIYTNCSVADGQKCSGHGTCEEFTGLCICDDGYGGGNCYNQTCSTSKTWFGDTGNHTTYSICGGVGYCNGTDGTCYDCGGSNMLYYGDSCEYLSCYGVTGGSNDYKYLADQYSDGIYDDTYTPCNGNGACLTMQEIAELAYNSQKELSNYVYTTPWDADMIRGCMCQRAPSANNRYYPSYYESTFFMNKTITYFNTSKDLYKFYRGPYAWTATDFYGYNCLNKRCPTGDNPQTPTQYNEVQKLLCTATGGSFKLTFRENTTLSIPFDTTVAELETYLERLYTIIDVDVYYGGVGGRNSAVCHENDNIDIYIEFKTEFGDLPLITADVSTLTGPNNGVVITEETQGSKEDIECSGTGICNESTGVCACSVGYASSDGSLTTAGQRGDCTFVNKFEYL